MCLRRGKEGPLMPNLKLTLFTVSLRGGQEDLLWIFKGYAEKTQKTPKTKTQEDTKKNQNN